VEEEKMKAVSSLILLFCLFLVVSLSNSQTTGDETDTLLKEMFNYANTHNLEALEGLRDQIRMKKDRELTAAYSLALYIAAPKKYKQQYADNFPGDSEGMRYFSERIELKGLTPSYLYIDAIGRIAEEGNDKAIEKVIIGFTLSDGGAAELFCDYLEKLFDKQLRKTLRAFSRIEEGLRQKTYICFELMEGEKFSSLKSKLRKLRQEATKSEIKVIDEIDKYQE
jgi:hypothetical protein